MPLLDCAQKACAASEWNEGVSFVVTFCKATEDIWVRNLNDPKRTSVSLLWLCKKPKTRVITWNIYCHFTLFTVSCLLFLLELIPVIHWSVLYSVVSTGWHLKLTVWHNQLAGFKLVSNEFSFFTCWMLFKLETCESWFLSFFLVNLWLVT